MMPIGNRPVVDYVVEDCVRAGIERIIFVVAEDCSQLIEYYSENPRLDQYLEKKGDQEKLIQLRNVGYGLKFEYVKQPYGGQYGTAVPLYRAYIDGALGEEEAFVVMNGDAFAYAGPGNSVISEAIETYCDGSNYEHLAIAPKIPREKASLYGLMKVDNDYLLTDFIEKPPIELVPTPALININNFIFSKSVLEQLNEYMHQPAPKENGGEYFITDVLLKAAKSGQSVKVKPVDAQYLDAGNAESWLEANNLLFGRS